MDVHVCLQMVACVRVPQAYPLLGHVTAMAACTAVIHSEVQETLGFPFVSPSADENLLALSHIAGVRDPQLSQRVAIRRVLRKRKGSLFANFVAGQVEQPEALAIWQDLGQSDGA